MLAKGNDLLFSQTKHLGQTDSKNVVNSLIAVSDDDDDEDDESIDEDEYENSIDEDSVEDSDSSDEESVSMEGINIIDSNNVKVFKLNISETQDLNAVEEEEYLHDFFQAEQTDHSEQTKNYKLNKFGHEKGLVVEFFKKNDKTFYYDYSPVCLLGEELEKWKSDIIKKHETDKNILFSSFAYWYLEKVSCVPIYRNQEWFNKARISQEAF